jgi:hypothetical protein
MLRFFAALGAALVSFVPALFIAAALSLVFPSRVQNVVAPVVFVAVPILAFAFVYRLVPRSRRALRADVKERQQLAIARGLPAKAQTIAGGGDGVWQTDRWRVTGGDTPSIAILENGAWTTVFQAKFHQGEPGQWVTTKITRDYPFVPRGPMRSYQDPHTVHSEKRGGRKPRWEVLVYLSGPWEDELDEQLRAAEDAALARDRARMGLP